MNRTGKIIHGAGRGKTLGFPTVNLEGDFLDLEPGVYAVWVFCGEQRWPGALHHGANSTFGELKPHVEIFLLDFSGDLYGQQLSFEVVKKVRETQRFQSAEALVAQIQRDVESIKNILNV